jgi:hypothetical protein
MTLADCAAQAVLQWPRDDAITGVAIAGAESGWRTDAQGDHIDTLVGYYATHWGLNPDAPLPVLPAWAQQEARGLGLDPAGAAAAGRSLRQEFWRVWGPIACNGYTSFGAWQINTMYHQGPVRDATHSSDPCVWRDALFDVGFNCLLAHDIWAEAGWIRWSTYNGGQYAAYIDQATTAVDAALGVTPPTPVIPPPIWPPLPAGFLTLPIVDPLAAPSSLFPDVAPVEPPPGFH